MKEKTKKRDFEKNAEKRPENVVEKQQFPVFNFWFSSYNFKNFEQKDSKKCDFYSRCAWHVVKTSSVFKRSFERCFIPLFK
jgi:hypothetical protein